MRLDVSPCGLFYLVFYVRVFVRVGVSDYQQILLVQVFYVLMLGYLPLFTEPRPLGCLLRPHVLDCYLRNALLRLALTPLKIDWILVTTLITLISAYGSN